MKDYGGADHTEESRTVRQHTISLPQNHSVRHLGHVRDGVGIVHQFPLVHFNFTQSAKYQIKNFVITTHDSV